ncbi:NAD(P)/FAD-dependent oxidoreductase [Lacrimispora sp. 210928-DFI.3.58]|uniref:NAD(P)/FAD-dependent oxidoreductase n=1 Tax=Lacrimispora sp. 210928-DFI.3.58 TaxID=2883214 RepID=UPI0015B6A585|nr:FAD-dependent oxidoreductase [Lacrimispora sp. 210928-DFI.3.58]MCB7317746.1 FAD-dependent oxidoreductase [Lacrimispora sp. 210928-DFI.3.58]
MKYVVLGSSAAGINGVRELRKLDKDSEIVLISKDKAIYSRCILHHYLSNERNMEQLCFAEQDFADLFRVNWMKGRSCTGIKPEERLVILENGETVSYDKLLIATGSHTFVPPVKNLKKACNVTGFRNIEDVEALKAVAQEAENVIVMGAGLVGIDCAMGFLDLGVKVTLVEMAGWLLSKQLDERAAKTYQDAFERQGIKQYYGVGIAEVVLDEDNRIREAILTDGTRLPCDHVVVTAGVRSNVEFLEGTGIKTSRFGLIYDETGKTSNDNIYGAGDVSGTSPIWPAAVKEGIVAASNMAGVPRKMTDFFASKATMNFLGIPSMSLGDVNSNEDGITAEVRETEDSYKKILHKDGKIVGAVLQGDLAYGGILQQLIARKIDVGKVKKPIFDIDYSDFFHIKENFEFYYESVDRQP